MSVSHYHSLCNRYRGRAVEIRTHDGRSHRGIIRDVDGRRVYLEPLSRRRNLGGFASPFYGYGGYYGRRRSFLTGVALGSIATLVLLPFFFY